MTHLRRAYKAQGRESYENGVRKCLLKQVHEVLTKDIKIEGTMEFAAVRKG